MSLGFCKFPALLKNSGWRIGNGQRDGIRLGVKIYETKAFERFKGKHTGTALNKEWGI